MLKKILTLVGALFLIACGGIFMYIFRFNVPSHIVNIATVLGFAAGIVLVIAGFFLPKLLKGLRTLWQHKAGKVLLSAVLALALVGAGVFGGTLGTIVKAQHNTASNQSTVLVLGCQVRPGGTPSLMLGRRIDTAYDYLSTHPEAVAILCGGQGADEDMSEAQCIFEHLKDRGISPARMFLDDKSSNTDENIKNALEIIDANGLSEEVAVATSDFHQKRAAMICRRNNLTAAALNADTPGYLVPVYYTREVLGVLNEYVKYEMFADR